MDQDRDLGNPSSVTGKAIVLMGVSGSGKSTIGTMLAKLMNCRFLDADDFHPEANKEKMKQGIPLTDEERMPWLQTLRDTLRESLVSRKTVILACSALRRQYREILRSADANYEPGTAASLVKFVLLDAPVQVIAGRLRERAAQGTHFMPPTLLQSQLDLLRIDDSEGIAKVDATLSPEVVVGEIQSLLVSL